MHEFIAPYLESRHGWSQTTKKSVKSQLKTVIDFKFDPQNVVTQLKLQGYSSYTIKQYLIIARRFETVMKLGTRFNDYMNEHGYQFRSAYKEKTRKLTIKQVNEALKAIDTNPSFYNFVVLCAAGLRKTEATSARWDNFVAVDKLVVTGKGDKQRIAPVLQSRLKPTNSEFIVEKAPSWREFKKVFNDFTPHDLRAMFVTELVNSQTLSVKEVASLVGHSSIETTARYIRIDDKEVWGKLAKLGGLSND